MCFGSPSGVPLGGAPRGSTEALASALATLAPTPVDPPPASPLPVLPGRKPQAPPPAALRHAKTALELAFDLASNPRFDGLHGVNKEDGLCYPFRDSEGYATQGLGRLLSKDRTIPLSTWPPITQEKAWENFMVDLIRFQKRVRALVKAPMTPGMEGALIDFAFNAGTGALEVSTLLRKLNRGDPKSEVAAEFHKWKFAGRPPVVRAGLVYRRQMEAALFLS